MLEIIPIESIAISPKRQRQFFGEQELAELRESILTEKGLMTPILVRPTATEGKYYLVAGERRLRSIQTIEQVYGFGEQRIDPGFIPAVIKNFSSDMEAYEAELHENTMRVNLSWQEKATAIDALHKLKLSQNPGQKISQTAYLIDNTPTSEKLGYASSQVTRTTEQAILVSAYLKDPEVAKAASLKDATKIVTRKIEQEHLLKLRAYSEEKQKAMEAATAESEAQNPYIAQSGADEFDVSKLALSLPITPTMSPAVLLEGDMKERIRDVVDGSVNVIITDPPYGMGVDQFGDSGSSALPHEYSEEDFDTLHHALVGNMSRICSSSAHAYIFCDIDYFAELRRMVGDLEGWRVRRTPLIWNKGSTGNLADGSGQGYKRTHEYILYATRGKRPCSAVISDVLTFPMVKNKVHAAQKPVELYRKLLDMSSVPGDTVFDPFAGSGTIFAACRTFAVKPIGIELKPFFQELCKLAIEGKEMTGPEL